jgi:hypothetical protein
MLVQRIWVANLPNVAAHAAAFMRAVANQKSGCEGRRLHLERKGALQHAPNVLSLQGSTATRGHARRACGMVAHGHATPRHPATIAPTLRPTTPLCIPSCPSCALQRLSTWSSEPPHQQWLSKTSPANRTPQVRHASVAQTACGAATPIASSQHRIPLRQTRSCERRVGRSNLKHRNLNTCRQHVARPGRPRASRRNSRHLSLTENTENTDLLNGLEHCLDEDGEAASKFPRKACCRPRRPGGCHTKADRV